MTIRSSPETISKETKLTIPRVDIEVALVMTDMIYFAHTRPYFVGLRQTDRTGTLEKQCMKPSHRCIPKSTRNAFNHKTYPQPRPAFLMLCNVRQQTWGITDEAFYSRGSPIFFSEAPHLRNSIPHPKTDFSKKNKMHRGEYSHGPSL